MVSGTGIFVDFFLIVCLVQVDHCKAFTDCNSIPAVPNAVSNPPGGPIAHGSTVTYTCDIANRYSPKVGAVMTYTCYAGKIYVNTAECVKECQAPVNPAVVPGNGQWTPHGEYVIFTCTGENTMTDKGERMCLNGNWDPVMFTVPFVCKANCQVPPTITKIFPKGGEYVTHDITVKFRCDQYHMIDPSNVVDRKCSNAIWTPDFNTSPFICNKMFFDCEVPDIPNISPPYQTLKDHMDELEFSCVAGYSPEVGAIRTRKCNNQIWEPDLSKYKFECKSQCTVPIIRNVIYPLSGIKMDHWESAIFECATRFTPDVGQVAIRKCIDGDWEPLFAANPAKLTVIPKFLQCKMQCQVPVIAQLALPVSGSWVDHGPDVEFTCEEYHEPLATHITTRDCNNGAWDPIFNVYNDLLCTTSFWQCQVPPFTYISSPARGTLVDHGERVTFVCNARLSPVIGHIAERKCMDGGWDPPFDATNPFECKNKCLIPPIPEILPSKGTYRNHGNYTAFSCDAGFQTDATHLTRRMCNDGKWEPPIDLTRPIGCRPLFESLRVLAMRLSLEQVFCEVVDTKFTPKLVWMVNSETLKLSKNNNYEFTYKELSNHKVESKLTIRNPLAFGAMTSIVCDGHSDDDIVHSETVMMNDNVELLDKYGMNMYTGQDGAHCTSLGGTPSRIYEEFESCILEVASIERITVRKEKPECPGITAHLMVQDHSEGPVGGYALRVLDKNNATVFKDELKGLDLFQGAMKTVTNLIPNRDYIVELDYRPRHWYYRALKTIKFSTVGDVPNRMLDVRAYRNMWGDCVLSFQIDEFTKKARVKSVMITEIVTEESYVIEDLTLTQEVNGAHGQLSFPISHNWNHLFSAHLLSCGMERGEESDRFRCSENFPFYDMLCALEFLSTFFAVLIGYWCCMVWRPRKTGDFKSKTNVADLNENQSNAGLGKAARKNRKLVRQGGIDDSINTDDIDTYDMTSTIR